jgi:UDP-N-acetylglucosamine 2-epimerase (non-hydrolysing)
MRAVLIAGARPNFMKVKPVLDALEQRGAHTTLVHTGQRRGDERHFFDELGIRAPDHSLGVGSGTHAEQTSQVMVAFEPLLDKLAADVVVVVGDVNSTMACTLVAAQAVIPVAHVEAGLRSRDWTMPEEVNRVVTDRLSRYLLAPSEDAIDNLRAEGTPDEHIHLVGNVVVDTPRQPRPRASHGRAASIRVHP